MFKFGWKPKENTLYKPWIKAPKDSKGRFMTGYNHWFEVFIYIKRKQHEGTFLVNENITTIHIYENQYHFGKKEILIVSTKKCKFKKHMKSIPPAGQGRDWGKVTIYKVFVKN